MSHSRVILQSAALDVTEPPDTVVKALRDAEAGASNPLVKGRYRVKLTAGGATAQGGPSAVYVDARHVSAVVELP